MFGEPVAPEDRRGKAKSICQFQPDVLNQTYAEDRENIRSQRTL